MKVLSRLFRRLFLEALEQAFQQGKLQFFSELSSLSNAAVFAAYLKPLRESEWVVYAKPPFGGPQQVLAYLGRYTHRVAISNQRLLSLEEGQVTFQWKDYKHHNKQNSKTMTVDANEFIRRFLIHTLPPGFQRIRHFGLLANCHRKAKLALCRQLLLPPIVELLPQPAQTRPRLNFLTKNKPVPCPQCGIGTMVRVAHLLAYRWPAMPPENSSGCDTFLNRRFSHGLSLQPPRAGSVPACGNTADSTAFSPAILNLPATPPPHYCSALSSELHFAHPPLLSVGIQTPYLRSRFQPVDRKP